MKEERIEIITIIGLFIIVVSIAIFLNSVFPQSERYCEDIEVGFYGGTMITKRCAFNPFYEIPFGSSDCYSEIINDTFGWAYCDKVIFIDISI